MLTIFESDLFHNIDFLKSIVDSIEEGIVIQNKDGRIIGFNDNATHILSLTPDQLLGKTSYDPQWHAIFLDGSPAPGEAHPITVTLRTGKPQNNVIMGVQTIGNTRRWLSINTRFLKQDNDVFVFAMFRDVTLLIQEINEVKKLNQKFEERNFELLQTQDELRRKINQLKVFAGIITHDVRGPAGNIEKLLELQESETSLETKLYLLDSAKKASTDLNNNLNELVQMLQVHIEENIPYTNCDLDSLTATIFEELQKRFEKKHPRIITDFKLPTIRYPKVYMQSILYNLLSNAVKYTRTGINPVITISSWVDTTRCYLSVSDNGLGLDMNKYGAKLFQFKESFHTGFNSKGIGLYLIRNQIEDLGGSISAESEVGIGTTFIVKF